MTRGREGDARPVVLVCDDDPDVLELLCDMLEAEGYRAVPCGGARSLLEASASERPALVVMDLHLPDGDVATTLEGLRRTLAETPPVLCITGAGAGDACIAEALGAGAREVLRKPFSVADLAGAAARLLGG